MKVNNDLVDFENKISAYFAKCQIDGIYPDEAGLILFLNISHDTYEKYKLNSNGKFSGFARCIEEARLRRESIIVRDIYSSDSKSPTGKIFLARQPGNGGLTDKPRDSSKKLTVEVVLDPAAVDNFE